MVLKSDQLIRSFYDFPNTRCVNMRARARYQQRSAITAMSRCKMLRARFKFWKSTTPVSLLLNTVVTPYHRQFFEVSSRIIASLKIQFRDGIFQ